MAATLRPGQVAAILRLLPPPLLRRLDAWSQRVAKAKADARRRIGQRKVAPLAPVVAGRVTLPHPFH